ncbi:MAG TPA: YCF48-related protein [Pyrinomonadaceae bacterium]|jgi:photosystem II stability/assembly factor-like uncharacterized protein
MQTEFIKKVLSNLLCVALCLAAGFVSAQAGTGDNAPETLGRFGAWQGVGPLGGDVRSLVVDPKDKDRLYFGTLDGQIYTSPDGGKSWRILYNFNRPQLVIDNILIDSRDSRTLYVAAHRHKEGGGFYKSTDGGANWRQAKDLQEEAVYAIAQSASNPDMFAVGTYHGVFVSFDSGNNWEKLHNENIPGLTNVESLAIDPKNPDVIYAGTWYLPYKTTDGGKTWRVIKQGMIEDSDVFAIDIDPRNSRHIFASACSGIYESKNSGENWTKVQGIPSQSRRTRWIVQHPSKPGYVFAATTEGFWMTADGGSSWALTTSRQLEINMIAVHPEEPNKVFIGTNNYGIMVSSDFGKTFSMTNAGFSTRLTKNIVADLEKPNRLYSSTINTATGGGFFFVSEDGGDTWRASMKNYPQRLIVYSILQDQEELNTIYLGTNFGIYRSLDRGVSWAAVTAPKKPVARKAPARKGKAVAKKPAAKPAANVAQAPKPLPKTVDALTERVNQLIPTHDGKNGMYAATDTGLYRTYDIAKGWERLAYSEDLDKQTLTVAVSDQLHERIWVGTAKSGVLSSRDGGKTWKQEAGVQTVAPISRIEIDPQRADYVYVGTKQTFFLTRNGGEEWQRRGGGLPMGDYVSILVNPRNPNEIIVGSALEIRGGAYRSMDAGMTWERFDQLDANIPSRRVWALAFDPQNQNRILIGSHSAGIYIADRVLTARN